MAKYVGPILTNGVELRHGGVTSLLSLAMAEGAGGGGGSSRLVPELVTTVEEEVGGGGGGRYLGTAPSSYPVLQWTPASPGSAPPHTSRANKSSLTQLSTKYCSVSFRQAVRISVFSQSVLKTVLFLSLSDSLWDYCP